MQVSTSAGAPAAEQRDLSGRTGEPITTRPDTRRTPPPEFRYSLPPCAIQASNLFQNPRSS